MKPITLAAALLLSIVAGISANAAPPAAVGSMSASVRPASVRAGGKGVATIAFTVAPGYHINANKPADPMLIPAVLTVTGPKGVKFGAPVYPAAQSVKASYSPKPLLVYQGKVKIAVPFTVDSSAKAASVPLKAQLAYQACNATSCNPPATASASAALTIAAKSPR